MWLPAAQELQGCGCSQGCVHTACCATACVPRANDMAGGALYVYVVCSDGTQHNPHACCCYRGYMYGGLVMSLVWLCIMLVISHIGHRQSCSLHPASRHRVVILCLYTCTRLTRILVLLITVSMLAC
ncbi:hypothetical protein V8C86DRAFT_83846 [Haematococcus lacustris]